MPRRRHFRASAMTSRTPRWLRRTALQSVGSPSFIAVSVSFNPRLRRSARPCRRPIRSVVSLRPKKPKPLPPCSRRSPNFADWLRLLTRLQRRSSNQPTPCSNSPKIPARAPRGPREPVPRPGLGAGQVERRSGQTRCLRRRDPGTSSREHSRGLCHVAGERSGRGKG